MFSTNAFALTGSDINKAGYGPIINNIQLGSSTSLINFCNAALANHYKIYNDFS
jgi:hypothetical protein